MNINHLRNLLKTIITSRLKIILSILILVVLLSGLALTTYLTGMSIAAVTVVMLLWKGFKTLQIER